MKRRIMLNFQMNEHKEGWTKRLVGGQANSSRASLL